MTRVRALVGAAALAAAGTAKADEPAPSKKGGEDAMPMATSPATESQPTGKPARDPSWLPEGVFVPVGVNIGGVDHKNGDGGLIVGAEASVVMFPIGHGNWTGAYVDALYDGGSDRARGSIGLEFGYMMLGVDGGVLAQVGAEPVRAGLQVRPMLSLGLLHIYGRWGWLFGGSDRDDRFVEVGVLFKVPFQVHNAQK